MRIHFLDLTKSISGDTTPSGAILSVKTCELQPDGRGPCLALLSLLQWNKGSWSHVATYWTLKNLEFSFHRVPAIELKKDQDGHISQ